ncbi:hypothetical protein C6P97_30980 [Burkholderia multivorans]|nr:hypothetical protein C6P97_30980 [Burkholderia multivorans]
MLHFWPPRKGGFQPFQSQGTMDFSSIWNTGTVIVSAVSALIGGALGMIVRGIDVRQKFEKLRRELQQAEDEARARRAAAVRAARDAARNLEVFAHACHALTIENARGLRAGDAISFKLPELARVVGVGNSEEALELESAYRDLHQHVRSVNEHIAETCRDDHHGGPAEALSVLDARAYETAALALKLADRYRQSFDVPRTRLGGREHRIEAEILTRADEEGGA